MPLNPLKNIVKKQKNQQAVGIYSACSSNPFVIDAVLEKARDENTVCLIESTANQVDQNGGYSGMTPKDFRQYVLERAKALQVNPDLIYMGGDHLGPLTKSHLPEKEAMKYAEQLVHDYVKAGFAKIHIDTSMRLADDDPAVRLSDETIARRGAQLAKVCEEAYQELKKENPNAIRPVYIVGSEVPIPGGATDSSSEIQITTPEDLKNTLSAFEKAFRENGLEDTWQDVIGVVVQPGVEEKDAGCTEYDRTKAKNLMESIKNYDNLVFEGHSTDYQTKEKLKELVEDGVGILKVGPALTYAVREGLFALAYMEDILFHDKPEQASHFIDILEQTMLEDPSYWKKYYSGSNQEQWLKRKFSFSDRSRYYMPEQKVQQAIQTMFKNLETTGVDLSVLSQFMPEQYTKVREKKLNPTPHDLVKDKVKKTIDEYLYASHQKELTQ